MNKVSRLILLFCALLVVGVGPTLSADLQKCFAATERGDYATALAEMRPLAEQGNPTAQVHMGLMYTNGHGVSQDHRIAVEWFKDAAKQGYHPGQYSLANAYLLGQGVARDFGSAFKWFARAAEQGSVPAQSNLGVMYALGDGVKRDSIQAYMWFSIAASRGDEKGRRFKAKVEKSMTPAQIAAANKLAGDWIERHRN